MALSVSMNWLELPEPRAMETRSTVNYMYPFEQAALALATHGIHGQLPRDYVETEALTVIYKLLRIANGAARSLECNTRTLGSYTRI
mmetsp:Transcript_13033/g.23607  ORF Transcript_13033/g.23607 Transcript_13033/m.23607 type:complete len:87 (-) Transcript_13033:62-322(-)